MTHTFNLGRERLVSLVSGEATQRNPVSKKEGEGEGKKKRS